MDKVKMMDTVKAFIAQHLNCTEEDLQKDGVIFVPNDRQDSPFLEISTMGRSVIVSASTEILPKVETLLKGKSRDEIFECPFVYGQSIYYVPDLKHIQRKQPDEKYEYRLLQNEEIKQLQGIQGFENSLAFDENGDTPTCIVYYAMKDGEIIALAGASKESDSMWEIGVDVKMQFRNEGLASILVSNLVMSILEKDVVPFYCASVTNIASQAVAYRSGLMPCWVSTYRTVLDGSSVYDEIVKKDRIWDVTKADLEVFDQKAEFVDCYDRLNTQIHFSAARDFSAEDILDLFQSVDWLSSNYPERVKKALNNCETVYTAWDGEKLVGLVNAMDDGEMTAYVHYLCVNPKYQGRGIGKELIRRIKEKYSAYLYIILIAEKESLVPYYRSNGFELVDGRYVFVVEKK